MAPIVPSGTHFGLPNSKGFPTPSPTSLEGPPSRLTTSPHETGSEWQVDKGKRVLRAPLVMHAISLTNGTFLVSSPTPLAQGRERAGSRPPSLRGG